MNTGTPPPAGRTPPTSNEPGSQVPPGSKRPFLWDVEEALTRVSYGFFRHLKNQTRPDDSELVDWWHQILNTQIAIGALIAECERAVVRTSQHDTRQQLAVALVRVGAGCPSGLE